MISRLNRIAGVEVLLGSVRLFPGGVVGRRDSKRSASCTFRAWVFERSTQNRLASTA